jgi:hypothetical protein
VFYELHAERERQGKQNNVAIVRLEQLAPFPFDLVCRELYRCGGRRLCPTSSSTRMAVVACVCWPQSAHYWPVAWRRSFVVMV